ncbi:shikimate dehydrogenase [Alphaproteobacteria bacterium LSUCC0684]
MSKTPPEHSITGTTRVFGVIADPIAHVRAPMVFNPVFAERGVDAVLVPLHIPEGKLEETIRVLAAMPNMGGVCVTIPHKMALARLCDELGTAAEITGAVNAVRFDGGRLIGDNFDGAGFVAGCLGEGIEIRDRKILMLGAGGAARAVAAALAENEIAHLTVANRSIDRAEDLTARLRQYFPDLSVEVMKLEAGGPDLAGMDMVINTTSLGLHAGDALPCGLDSAGPQTVIADIIMIPPITPWMIEAHKKGLKTHPGRHMLDYQRDLMFRFLKMAA